MYVAIRTCWCLRPRFSLFRPYSIMVRNVRFHPVTTGTTCLFSSTCPWARCRFINHQTESPIPFLTNWKNNCQISRQNPRLIHHFSLNRLKKVFLLQLNERAMRSKIRQIEFIEIWAINLSSKKHLKSNKVFNNKSATNEKANFQREKSWNCNRFYIFCDLTNFSTFQEKILIFGENVL